MNPIWAVLSALLALIAGTQLRQQGRTWTQAMLGPVLITAAATIAIIRHAMGA